jgi:hypothetical protein
MSPAFTANDFADRPSFQSNRIGDVLMALSARCSETNITNRSDRQLRRVVMFALGHHASFASTGAKRIASLIKPFQEFTPARRADLRWQAPPSVGIMHRSMLSVICQLQIIWTIVQSVSVHVMHNFVCCQRATKALLHHQAMFQDVPAGSRRDIPRRRSDKSVPAFSEGFATVPAPIAGASHPMASNIAFRLPSFDAPFGSATRFERLFTATRADAQHVAMVTL